MLCVTCNLQGFNFVLYKYNCIYLFIFLSYFFIIVFMLSGTALYLVKHLLIGYKQIIRAGDVVSFLLSITRFLLLNHNTCLIFICVYFMAFPVYKVTMYLTLSPTIYCANFHKTWNKDNGTKIMTSK